MKRIMLSMVVREGCEAEFVRTWRAFAPSVGEQPGNAGQTMLRDLRDARRYVIMSDWADEDALRTFQGTDLRRDLSAALDALRERASGDNTLFEVVCEYRREAEAAR